MFKFIKARKARETRSKAYTYGKFKGTHTVTKGWFYFKSHRTIELQK